jgi:phospholipase/carboxylesterase
MTGPEGLFRRLVPARSGAPLYPGLILLHGRGADEEDLLGLTGALDPRLAAVSLRAPFDWPGGGYCWYHLPAPGQPDVAGLRQSLARLAGVLDALPAWLPVDPGRVYLLGFSQGAVMAHALLLAAPARVAGAILLSGFRPPPGAVDMDGGALRGRPVFVGHGRTDALIAVERGREARDALRDLGVEVTYREYDHGHRIAEEEIVDIRGWLAARLGTG